jgi:very-short-patch-repair endonuclease
MNRYIHRGQSLKTRARDLRKNATPTERLLWLHLSKKQIERYKFRRQHVIAPYILDFYCSSKKLAIEIDGGSHIDHEKYDQVRNEYLRSKGITVIRFTNTEVTQNTSVVLEIIIEKLNCL